MRVFATYSIKGGVGKTATAVNLAYLSSVAGARTLIWDLDPQGAATFHFRIQPKIRGGLRKLFRKPADAFIRGTDYQDLDLLPSDFSYRELDLALHGGDRKIDSLNRILRPLRRDYDHVYIDCAPGISLASDAVFAVSSGLLVPTIPSALSMRTLEQLHEYLAKHSTHRPRVIPFHCMVDRRRALHRDVLAKERSDSTTMLESWIPYSSAVEQMSARRAPLEIYAASSEAAASYRALWREALSRLDSWSARLTLPESGAQT